MQIEPVDPVAVDPVVDLINTKVSEMAPLLDQVRTIKREIASAKAQEWVDKITLPAEVQTDKGVVTITRAEFDGVQVKLSGTADFDTGPSFWPWYVVNPPLLVDENGKTQVDLAVVAVVEAQFRDDQ